MLWAIMGLPGRQWSTTGSVQPPPTLINDLQT
jgi:hypothetical protein